MSKDVEPSRKDTNDGENTNLPADVADSQAARYRTFARHVASCGNPSKAARLTGWSAANAGQQAYRLMQRPEVLAMIDEERQERAHRLRVDDDRIIAAYATIAFHDAREVVKWDANGVAVVGSSDDLTDDEAMLVQAVEVKERVTPDGETITTTTVKLAPRQPALDALAKIKGLMRERIEIEGLNGVANEMAEIRARRQERLAASNAARPIEITVVDELPLHQGEVIEHEPRSASATLAEEISLKANGAGPLTHDPRSKEIAPPAPGIASRFAALTPRDDET